MKTENINSNEKQEEKKKPSTWEIIIRILYALAGLLTGVTGANAMNAMSGMATA